MVATIARPSTTHAHQDETRTPRFVAHQTAAGTAPTIDEAERLIVDLARVIPYLGERDGSNIGHVLDQLGQAAGSREDLVAEAVADAIADIGPGNRVHDRIDREIAAAKRAFLTHAAVVERYAASYRYEIREELYAAHGEELGKAIADAASHQHQHDTYGHGGNPATCEDCWS